MKVSELEGVELDYWVERAEGVGHRIIVDSGGPYAYSIDWCLGGPIIERERITIDSGVGVTWRAFMFRSSKGFVGPTPLIAAMRCYVASKYGEEVPDQESP